MSRVRPSLSGIVVHWRDEEAVESVAADWPADPRFELVVVDNGSRRPLALPSSVVLLTPGTNLGFAGGLNAGIQAADADLLLVLNADASPTPGAPAALVAGFDRFPETAGLAPRLVGPGGDSQHAWQLQPLPTPADLLLHTLLVDRRRGPIREPSAGTVVEQPAAAALAVRRAALERLAGLDPRFWPAWFEDVDLGRRMAAAELTVRYWPEATVQHRGAGSVPELGYGRFLPAYYGNLLRYLAAHHGRGWVLLARASLAIGMLGRTLLLPLRTPRRAGSRRDAATALLGTAIRAAAGRSLVPRKLV